MSRMPFAVLTLTIVFTSIRTNAVYGAEPPVHPKVHPGKDWALAVPDNWKPFAGIRPPMQLYLVGDGQPGMPMVDGTLSALKCGLTVEVLPAGAAPAAAKLQTDLKEMTESGAFEALAEPRREDLKLADGTAATVMDFEFVRLQNGRVSFQTKLYCDAAGGQTAIVTGFITCSRAGAASVRAMGLPTWLRGHVKSLVLDKTKADAAALQPAYAAFNWMAARAIGATRQANNLLEQERYADAIAAFRVAVDRFDHIPAAHNGLAWALLHQAPADVAGARAAAEKAVTQTEGLDFAALDTLSLAQFRAGEREAAVKTIEKALLLAPKNADLLARRRSFDQPGK